MAVAPRPTDHKYNSTGSLPGASTLTSMIDLDRFIGMIRSQATAFSDRFTVPLYFADGSRRPCHLATAICLAGNNATVLVTAKHAFDAELHNVFVPAGENLISTDGVLLTPSPGRGSEKKDDELDVAFLRLDPDVARQLLRHYRALPMDGLSYAALTPNDLVYLYGYPTSRQERHYSPMRIGGPPLALHTTVLRSVASRNFRQSPFSTNGNRRISGTIGSALS